MSGLPHLFFFGDFVFSFSVKEILWFMLVGVFQVRFWRKSNTELSLLFKSCGEEHLESVRVDLVEVGCDPTKISDVIFIININLIQLNKDNLL